MGSSQSPLACRVSGRPLLAESVAPCFKLPSQSHLACRVSCPLLAESVAPCLPSHSPRTNRGWLENSVATRSGEWRWLANYREFSGDSEWRVVVADELLFVFGFIFASIVCEDGIDYRPPWQYGLASQNSACQHVNACKQNMQRYALFRA